MKALIYIFITCNIFFSLVSCSYAQNRDLNKSASQMLKEFYQALNGIKLVKKDSAKWNFLQKKYCTYKLGKEAKEWRDDGHDLFTDDWGIDTKALQTLVVVRDLTKKNTYTVSYIVNFHMSPNKWQNKKVVLYIRVAKDGESYKIDSIKSGSVSKLLLLI